jgi:hypothetical protein
VTGTEIEARSETGAAIGIIKSIEMTETATAGMILETAVRRTIKAWVRLMAMTIAIERAVVTVTGATRTTSELSLGAIAMTLTDRLALADMSGAKTDAASAAETGRATDDFTGKPITNVGRSGGTRGGD